MIYKNLHNLFEQQAVKRKAKKKGGMLARPYLILTSGNVEIKVGFEKRQKRLLTTISCVFSTQCARTLCIYPQKYGSIRIQVGPGVQDIILNSPEFDKLFIIQSDSDSFAKDYLISYVQERLLSIRRFYPTVKIKDKKFKMYAPGKIKNSHDLDDFIDSGLMLIERYKDW